MLQKIETETTGSFGKKGGSFSHTERERRSLENFNQAYAPINGSKIFDVVKGIPIFRIESQSAKNLVARNRHIIGDSLLKEMQLFFDEDTPVPPQPPQTSETYQPSGGGNNCGNTGSMRGAMFNNRAIKSLRAPFSSEVLFPVFSGDGWGSTLETVIEPQLPVVSAARVCCSENIPVVTNAMIPRCYLHTGYTDLAISSSNCYSEMQQMNYSGLDSYIDEAVLEALKFAANEIAFLGDGEKVKGIVNSNYIPSYYFPPLESLDPIALYYALAGLRMLLPNRPLESIGNGGLSGLLTGTAPQIPDSTWLLAISDQLYQQIAVTMLPTTPSTTILQALETGNCACPGASAPLMPRVRVIPVPEFDSLGDECRPFGLLWRYGSIEQRKPISYLPLPPIYEGLMLRQVSIARVGSIIAYEPHSTLKIFF